MHISLRENKPLAWKLTAMYTPSLGCQGLPWKNSKRYENTSMSRKDQMGKRNGLHNKSGIRSFCPQRSLFPSISPSSVQLHTCVHIWRTPVSPMIPKGPRIIHQHLPASDTQWMLNMHLLNEWTGWQCGPLGCSPRPAETHSQINSSTFYTSINPSKLWISRGDWKG